MTVRVCFLIGQLNIAGAQKQLYELVREIDRKRFTPSVVSLSSGGKWSSEIRNLGVEVVEIQRTRSWELGRLVKLYRILGRLRPHILHTYLFPANTYGRIAALPRRIPIVIASERNTPEIGKDKTVFQLTVDKLLAPFTDAIVCNTAAASAILTAKYAFDRKKVFTVHNGIRADAVPPVSGRTRDHRLVCSVGRLWPQKNHQLFLDMAGILGRTEGLPKTLFRIVGSGPERAAIEAHAASLGIDAGEVLAGERHDVMDILSSADVLVVTSNYEGLSNTIMEGMLCGVPVVATDVGGNRELVVDGVTGYLCPAGDAAALAAKVGRLLHDREAARRMGSAGRQRIRERFTVQRMVAETEQIYERCMAKRWPAAASSSVRMPHQDVAAGKGPMRP